MTALSQSPNRDSHASFNFKNTFEKPGSVFKFVVDKLLSASQVRLSLISKATLVIKRLFRKLFSCSRVNNLPPEVVRGAANALIVG